MGYGEATPEELYKDFKVQIKQSFKHLGVVATFIPFVESQVTRGALGGVQRSKANTKPIPVKCYYIPSPSENIRRMFGITDVAEDILILEKSAFPYTLTDKDKFQIFQREYTVRSIKADALFMLGGENDSTIIVVGIVSK
jgi:hypothetical protein